MDDDHNHDDESNEAKNIRVARVLEPPNDFRPNFCHLDESHEPHDFEEPEEAGKFETLEE